MRGSENERQDNIFLVSDFRLLFTDISSSSYLYHHSLLILMSSASFPTRAALWLAVLSAAFAVKMADMFFGLMRIFVYDDTYINLRYAANFINSGALDWNIGERVEGYTTFLHVILCAGLGALGMDLLDAARAINFVSYGAAACLPFLLFRQLCGLPLVLMGAALIIINPNLIGWVWGGMETPFSVFILGLGHGLMLYALRTPESLTARLSGLIGFAFGLATLTRPDHGLHALMAGLFILYGATPRWKNFIAFLIPAGLLVGGQMLFRIFYYHDILPNTFYAKMVDAPAATALQGLHYIIDGLAAAPGLYAAGLTTLVTLLFLKDTRRMALYGLGSIGLNMFYILKTGGDHMPGFRFMLPWLCLCVFALILLGTKIRKDRQVFFIAALLPLLAWNLDPKIDIRSIDTTALVGRTVGEYIQKNWPQGSVVALNAAGAIPYFNKDKKFIDMMGLNDKHIARRAVPDRGLVWQKKPGHSKGDGAYVLARKPDFIILSSSVGDASSGLPVLLSDLELKESQDFASCYKRETRHLPWPTDLLDYSGALIGEGLTKDSFTFSYYRRTCAK